MQHSPSHRTKERKLAAILFADIVGYTALMENDEASAAQALAKFKAQLQEKVAAHKGRIINFYGDGCLAIFENPNQALQCGAQVQRAFQQAPTVPVRIGLHSGAVVLEDENVYGDAVNQASRLESIGIAGSVLFSQNIYEHIKNQGVLQCRSLGTFEFKNVKRPIEVFALTNPGFAVPKRSEIQGKLKRPGKALLPRWLLVLATITLAGMGIFFWQHVFAKPVLPQEIRESRIAVLPYENNTNDTQLDVLGNMAADWITRNLSNVEQAKIVQFENVKGHLQLFRETPLSFARQTGAEHMIRGRFYQEGEQLIFESRIIDPSSSEVLFVFPELRGHKAKPSQLIDELSQQIAGYFAFRQKEFYSFSVAPKYEAFIAYEEGVKNYVEDFEKAKHYFEEAINIDSNFLNAYILYGGTHMIQGKWAMADSIYQEVQKRFVSLPRLEKYSLAVAMALVRGDLAAEYENMKGWFEIDPKPFAVNYQFAHVARRFNKPQEVVEACSNIDLTSVEFDMPIKNWWFEVYAEALINLGHYEEALGIIQRVPVDVNPLYFIRQRIFSFQDRPDSLHQLILEMENKGVAEDRILRLMAQIAIDYALLGQHEQQKHWANKMLQRINNQPENAQADLSRLTEAYYLFEDYESALFEYQSLVQSKRESRIHLQRLGCIYAKLGNREKAMEYWQKLKAKDGKYSFGRYIYSMAVIHAALGDKEKALALLKQAFQKGAGFNIWVYRFDFDLIPLQHYPPFEEFVRPKTTK